ncbi:MAG: hypothetical protein GY854_02135 [Deltaproteobacteria bacterium]|nr:hypothetical protein [Deltaproteobacteria bacterium]
MGQYYDGTEISADRRQSSLVDAIERNGGKIIMVAHELGIHRSSAYRLIYKFRLWPVVNEARRQRLILETVEKRQKKNMP